MLIRDIQQLSHDAVIALYELIGFDPSSPYDTLRFTNHAGVRFGGLDYLAIPCEDEGYEFTGRGTLPRPKIRISNVNNFIGGFLAQYGDCLGATLIRRRTLAKYLDDRPTADPNQEFPRDIYRVQQRTLKNKFVVEFELSAAIDLVEETLPRRPVVANTCMWRYRSAECGYAGGAVAKADGSRTIYMGEDMCGKQISDCKLRFGAATLPFGGFPGVQRY